jgi:uncharacterized membrane protein YkvI
MNSAFFKKYLLPGFVFQSIVIGGGYGTGRELVEFFMTDGPLAGMLGMFVSMAIWSVVLAIGFELTRQQKTYDYRSFINGLLGKGWVLFEVVYVTGLVLVTAVMGSAAGEILNQMIGLPQIVGILIMIGIVGVLAFFGSDLIERFLSVWSVVLYVVFALVIALSLSEMGGDITDTIQQYDPESNWWSSGARYAAYNVGLMPAMLFTLRHLETKQEALVSGALAGMIAMLPGMVIYVSMLGGYPEITSEAIPIISLLSVLDAPYLMLALQIVLFGTFIETGVGLVHGFNERVAGVYAEKGKALPARLRAIIAVSLLVVSIFVADSMGLVRIIADGYGMLTWGYWLVFVIPVMTIGLYRVLRS